MTVATQNLAIALVGPNGQPLAQAEVNISVVESAVAVTAHVGRSIYTVYTDKDGLANVDLVPNSLMNPDKWYLCEVIQEPKGRHVVLYTVGFIMPDHDTNLHDIATAPGVPIIQDNLDAAGFRSYVPTEFWSEGLTFGAGIVTKDVLTNSYGESGFVANQFVKNGYCEFKFSLPALANVTVGLTDELEVNAIADLNMLSVEMKDDGTFQVVSPAIYNGTYVADDVIEVIVDREDIAHIYKNDILVNTGTAALGVDFPRNFAAALATDSAVIENMTLNGDQIGGS